MSNMILIFITFERLIAVTKPHKAQVLCTKKNASIAVIVVFVILCLLYIPILGGLKPRYYFIFENNDVNFIVHGECYYCCVMNSAFARLGIFLIATIIPFFVILFGNIAILVSLFLTHRTRRAMTSGSHSQSDSQLQSLTTMLLLVSFSYLILTFPYTVYAIVVPTVAHLYESFSKYWCSRMLSFQSTFSLLNINYSVNFILYCIGGKRFRDEFLTMIGCNNAKMSKSAQMQGKAIEGNPGPVHLSPICN